jgi:DNA repair protein RadA/Sms
MHAPPPDRPWGRSKPLTSPPAAQALALDDIDQADAPRTATGIGEFDRILGGGIVPGSAVLVGGEPGIGKSTLLLQVADSIANLKSQISDFKVLYVTSEESARQTKLRASRLNVESKNLLILAETNVERIINQIHKVSPAVVVIDSIQMIYKPDLPPRRGRSRSCAIAAWTWSISPRAAASRSSSSAT